MTTSILADAPATNATIFAAAKGLMVRGLRSIMRLPSAFLPAVLMPIFQSIAFSGTFFAITKVPGFPTDRSINWFMPLGACMGSAFAGVGLGFTLIRDLETGFFDRLRMSPAPRNALLLGPVAHRVASFGHRRYRSARRRVRAWRSAYGRRARLAQYVPRRRWASPPSPPVGDSVWRTGSRTCVVPRSCNSACS